jgi:hypothetical protein
LESVTELAELTTGRDRELIPTNHEVHPAAPYFYAEAPLELTKCHHLSLTIIL